MDDWILYTLIAVDLGTLLTLAVVLILLKGIISKLGIGDLPLFVQNDQRDHQKQTAEPGQPETDQKV